MRKTADHQQRQIRSQEHHIVNEKGTRTIKCCALIVISIASLLAASVTDAAPSPTQGRAVKPFTPELKPGDYVWHPEVSPAGPVVMFVNLRATR
jgi:hypothetical protein